ncbi:MAG: hypothetical protein NC898_02850 [Candidatus Omnitrophica bacterium]|nr:hypothetical protein [Candidatus Omnitrophota bacterium]MCM8793388.1 hypothetical protein [Candidatus Omnitrophota bacterium]
MAICNDNQFLQSYAKNIDFIKLSEEGFFELFALINNPLFNSSVNPRNAETGMTQFQEMIADGRIKIAIELMNDQRQGFDLEKIAEQLPRDELRKALAKSIFLLAETKEEIVRQMLPFFDAQKIDVKKRAQIGSTFSVLNLINDSAVSLGKFMEVQLNNWLSKFTNSREDGDVRLGAGTLLAYALRQQGGSEGVVGIRPYNIADQTWKKIIKGEKNIYLWEVGWEIISAVMDDFLHVTEFSKEELARDIYDWYILNNFRLDYRAFVLRSLLGFMADRRVAPELKLNFLPLFQEFVSQGYSWIGQAGIMQVISDPKISQDKKEELAEVSLEKLRKSQNKEKSLSQLLEENIIERFDLALLGLIAGQSPKIKQEITELLGGLKVSDKVLHIWKNYTVFVVGKDREFNDWEMERIERVLIGLPEEWRKTIGVIISYPENKQRFGRSGVLSRVLGATFWSGGMGIYGEIKELLKEKGEAEANRWFTRTVFHEIAHTRHFFGLTAEQIGAFQFCWESVDRLQSRVARDYGLTNFWEYVATLVEAYALDTVGFMTKAKEDAFLLEAFKTVVEALSYKTGDRKKVRIYRIESDGNLSWKEVDVGKDRLPVIPPDW